MIFYALLLLVFMVAGLLIGHVVLRRDMRSRIAQLQKRIDEAQAHPAVGNLSIAVPPASAPVAAPKPEPDRQTAPLKRAPAKNEVTPEILAVIAAAVAQFLGAGARIRSTRAIPVAEGNAWAQQGRVIIQASHNLAMR